LFSGWSASFTPIVEDGRVTTAEKINPAGKNISSGIFFFRTPIGAYLIKRPNMHFSLDFIFQSFYTLLNRNRTSLQYIPCRMEGRIAMPAKKKAKKKKK